MTISVVFFCPSHCPPAIDLVTVIGSLLEVEVEIEGVPVEALLDTGAQSTIISRSTLHMVVKHLRKNNRPVYT